MDLLQVLGIRKPKPQVRRTQSRSSREATLPELLDAKFKECVKQEDLQKYIDKMQKDKETLQRWNSLSNRKKLALLRYLDSKKRRRGNER